MTPNSPIASLHGGRNDIRRVLALQVPGAEAIERDVLDAGGGGGQKGLLLEESCAAAGDGQDEGGGLHLRVGDVYE